ncbi:hypothetical protein QN277_023131 [Acacia crassicarpa]|uniref:Uncharacterized protein n=1 Tax=Acacia crassicarpa TaxID=499986 RepID=A0AAE1JGN6_9FABA|nr:hypothetical protein QN277_023131 [Acacia crassicarpa]
MRPNTLTSLATDSYTINMPRTPSASPPQEDNILGFAVLAVELVGALSNLAASSKPEHNQVLIYVVVACSTLAFSISSTAHVLHKKRPTIAKKMQKAAFLIVLAKANDAWMSYSTNHAIKRSMTTAPSPISR